MQYSHIIAVALYDLIYVQRSIEEMENEIHIQGNTTASAKQVQKAKWASKKKIGKYYKTGEMLVPRMDIVVQTNMVEH